MDCLDKTLLTSSEDELKAIFDEESEKLRRNELILECLQRVSIDDFPHNLDENSKKNIEKALLAARITDFLDIGGGQTLMELDNFKLSNVKLSYTEKKMIRERVEKMVKKEVLRRSRDQTLDADIDRERNRLLEKAKENRELTATLERLKSDELTLLKEVTEKFLGSDQIEVVRGLLEEAELEEARIKHTCYRTEEFLLDQTSKSKEVLTELSTYLDELLIKKRNEK